MDLRLPQLSKKSSGAEIALWHVASGENLTEGQDLLEVVTDKATFDIPAPCNGKLVSIAKNKGDKVKTGEVLGEIQES